MTDKEISPDVQQKLAQLQMLEKNMQSFGMQKQMMQGQLLESESALEELKKAEQAFKIVGNIMVAAKKADLQKELQEKHDLMKKRVDSLESQEKKLQEKAESLQAELLKSIK